MAEQQNHKAAEPTSPMTFSPEQLAMIKLIMQEARKPFVDEDVVKRNEAARIRMREQREDSEAMTAARQDACSHLREDNTSRVAWHQFHHVAKKLFIYEGYCQLCNKHYFPGVPGYELMIKIPSGKPGIMS